MKIIKCAVCFCFLLFIHSAMAKLTPGVIDAARYGEVNILKKAVASGFDINQTDDHGYTLLILATYHGQYDTAKYLLSQGADPSLLDNHGRSALMGAAYKGDINAAKVILSDPRTNINQQNEVGQTAAMYAALFGHKAFLTYMLKQGADLSLSDKQGNSAATLAKQQGNTSLSDWITSQSK
ncbi:ankyrin repeat domain-containing protein [Rahnella bruchi]|uniref:ankyrin repeat domain-containing protein n=1 Tax=Rahnella bruchi TaxID=1510573 RepID=UPI000EA0B0AA|nr:ankyrin repeat domain-containing protein [Rahnella bruchi]